MGYRSIEVEGTTYEYVVGKSHVKVRSSSGMQRVLPKSEVGPAGRSGAMDRPALKHP